MITGLFLGLLFLLGAAIGSFLNVLVYRTVRNEDWISGRSSCESCAKPLAWFDMIPVLSFIMYRGRSRCCNTPLSYQHLVVESLTGIIFVWWYAIGFAFFQLVSTPMRSFQAGYWLAIVLILFGIALADYVSGIIPTVLVTIGIVLSTIYRFMLVLYGPMRIVDFVGYLGASLLAFCFYYFLHLVTHKKGMGFGDVILAPLLGLILGWPKILFATMYGFWLGAICGITLILLGRKKFGQTIPFGPFMILGTVIALFWNNQIWDWINNLSLIHF